jgi:autotransporter-associated beta strand protein
MRRRKFRGISLSKLSLAAGAALAPATARAQIFVVNTDATIPSTGGNIGEYSTSGANINAPLISGFSTYAIKAMAISGSELFVVNSPNTGYSVNNTIAEYSASGVATGNVTGFNSPTGVAVSGSEMYVVNSGNGTIIACTTSGTNQTVLVSGLNAAEGIAISGSTLFVANSGNNTIGEYTLATPTTLASSNAALINEGTGNIGPQDIAVSNGDLFITNAGNSTVSEYTTSGTLVKANLVGTVSNVAGIAVSGSDLYVTSEVPYPQATMGEYDTTTGDAINSFTSPAYLGDPNAVVVADAQTMYWDGGDAIHNSTYGGNGTWDLNNSINWDDGLAESQWMDSTSTGRDTAVFKGAAGNVTLNSAVSAAELQFLTTGYTISGTGNITLGSGGIDASALTSGNITLGVSIALASAQSWNVGTGTALSATGNISGAFALTKLGSGTLTLAGSNTYSNGTTISAGTLLANSADTVNGSTGSGLVTVASGAALGGVGQIRGSVSDSGTITAGNATTTGAPGTLTINNSSATTTLAGNGIFDVKINNATGAAGTNWDELVLSGLSITSAPASPFTITLYGLTAANSAGAVPNFNKNTSGNWTVATASGISAATLNADIAAGDFALSIANFTNNNSLSASGHFLLDVVTDGLDADLQIEYSPTPEPGVCLLFISAAVPILLGRRRRLHLLSRGVITSYRGGPPCPTNR